MDNPETQATVGTRHKNIEGKHKTKQKKSKNKSTPKNKQINHTDKPEVNTGAREG